LVGAEADTEAQLFRGAVADRWKSEIFEDLAGGDAVDGGGSFAVPEKAFSDDGDWGENQSLTDLISVSRRSFADKRGASIAAVDMVPGDDKGRMSNPVRSVPA
jgi:hypothetical protein